MSEEDIGEPSAFFVSELSRLRKVAPAGRVLDLACGRGRHSIAAARAGLEVLALDRNAESLRNLARVPILPPGTIEVIEADLEAGADPPIAAGETFSAVLVFRYLHRPLMPWIERAIAPGGWLLYETFTTAQRALGWGPRRDAFLLQPGELPRLFPSLEIVRSEEGPSADAEPAETARLLARRPQN